MPHNKWLYFNKVIKNKFIYLAITVATVYWLVEIAFDVLIFKKGNFRSALFALHDPNELWMRFVIVSVILTAGYISQRMANKITRAYEREKELSTKLENSIQEIKLLQGIVPICASCKKIRDDKGYWNQVEEYISEHSDVRFSHGMCPECVKKLYPEFSEKILKESK